MVKIIKLPAYLRSIYITHITYYFRPSWSGFEPSTLEICICFQLKRVSEFHLVRICCEIPFAVFALKYKGDDWSEATYCEHRGGVVVVSLHSMNSILTLAFLLSICDSAASLRTYLPSYLGTYISFCLYVPR